MIDAATCLDTIFSFFHDLIHHGIVTETCHLATLRGDSVPASHVSGAPTLGDEQGNYGATLVFAAAFDSDRTGAERFGLTIVRRAADSYAVRMLWDEMNLNWANLTRVQLLTSAFTPLLRALGQDLWQLLNQPIDGVTTHPANVA